MLRQLRYWQVFGWLDGSWTISFSDNPSDGSITFTPNDITQIDLRDGNATTQILKWDGGQSDYGIYTADGATFVEWLDDYLM